MIKIFETTLTLSWASWLEIGSKLRTLETMYQDAMAGELAAMIEKQLDLPRGKESKTCSRRKNASNLRPT